MSYQALDPLVLGRQLKVQELVLPYTIRAHNTAASVVLTPADPGILFLKSSGVDQITTAIDTGETVPGFTQVTIVEASTNQTGAMVKVQEKVTAIVGAWNICKNVVEAAQEANLVQEPASVAGIASVNSKSMYFTLKTAVANLATAPSAQTGTTVAGSNVVTGLSGQPTVGQLVVGTGVPANTIVIAQSGSQMTLSQNCTAAGAGVTVTYYNYFDGCLVVRYVTTIG